jgi:hypothetical protein
MTERDTRLTMPEAAGRLRWSVRYLKVPAGRAQHRADRPG